MKSIMKKRWAVVLAAGDGTRLRPLTRLLHGEDLPKQFATIEGRRSLLQVTLDRISAHFAPERTVVVVGRPFDALARRQLSAYEGIDVVVQPRNLGTGPGLLLPLARIRARDRSARVAIFPADHHIPRPEPLLEGVRSALDAAERPGLTLIGVHPDRPETEYGWIVPERGAFESAAGIQGVRRFVEKPDQALAEDLLRQGALWNTFISIGRLQEFWAAALRHMPRVARLFEPYVERVGRSDEAGLLERLYAGMEPANFSRSVLESLRGTPSGRRLLMRLATAPEMLPPVAPRGSAVALPV